MGNIESKEDLYDIVIDIRRISDVHFEKGGWPISVHNKIAETLSNITREEEALKLLQLDQQVGVAGVFGLFNRGKSFLLNQLAKIQLPSSKKIHTRGLSFLKSPDNTKFSLPIVFLDTAGTNTPLDREYWDSAKFSEPDEKRKVLAEKKITEMLIQHIAFCLSDIIIVVVNEITWPDQEFIEILRRKLENSNKSNKTLYIVHNYSDVVDELELFALWRQNVISSFHGKTVQSPIEIFGKQKIGIHFRQGGEDGELPALHFFLAKEGSPAGNVWNGITYALLRQVLTTCNVPDKPSLKESLLEAVDDGLKLYTSKPEKPALKWNQGITSSLKCDFPSLPKMVSRKGMKLEKIIDIHEWINCKPFIESPSRGQFSLTCAGDLSLTSTVDFVNFAPLVVPNRRATKFEPPFDYCLTKTGLLVMVDAPGISAQDINTEIKHEENGTVLKIQGIRKLFYLDYEKKDNWTVKQQVDFERLHTISSKTINGRAGGDFDIIIPLPPNIESNLQAGKVALKDGIFVVFLPFKITDTPAKISFDF